ncbi:MAG: transposase, partial [Segetibacter sp.]
MASPGGSTTAVGMSKMLKGQLSHDQITRFLAKGNFDSKYLWQQVKPMVQELSSSKEEIVLSFDDSIEEKYYSDPSELICWHFDHVFNRSVKGVNFLTALVNVAGFRVPCAVEFIKKDKWVTDEK